MNKLVTVVKRYWIAEETNIFKNYRDAIMGLVSLIIIPLFSICLVFAIEEYTFWNYSFPLISISWAGVYDCFGRFETKSPKNPKLVVRMVFNGISIFFPSFVQELVILVYQLFLQVYCFYVDCFCFFLKSIIKLNMRF